MVSPPGGVQPSQVEDEVLITLTSLLVVKVQRSWMPVKGWAQGLLLPGGGGGVGQAHKALPGLGS